MPARTRVVYGYIYKQDNTPYPNVKVKVTLCAPLWDEDYYKTVAPAPQVAVTDDNGRWEMALIVNEDLEPYKTSFYTAECFRPPTDFPPNELFMSFTFWLPYGDGAPVNVGTLLVGKGVKQPDLVGWVGSPVRSINHLTGEIYLRAGAGISITENINTSEITITNTGVYSLDGLKGDIELHALDGVKDELGAGNSILIMGDWSTVTPQPISAQSNLGVLHKLIPADHTHEGVHLINNMTGDVTISGIHDILVANKPNNDIVIGRDIFVIPSHKFQIIERKTNNTGGYTLDRFKKVHKQWIPPAIYYWNGSQYVPAQFPVTLTTTNHLYIPCNRMRDIAHLVINVSTTTPIKVELIVEGSDSSPTIIQSLTLTPQSTGNFQFPIWYGNTICNAIRIFGTASGNVVVNSVAIYEGMYLNDAVVFGYPEGWTAYSYAANGFLPAGQYDLNLYAIWGVIGSFFQSNPTTIPITFTPQLALYYLNGNTDTIYFTPQTITSPNVYGQQQTLTFSYSNISLNHDAHISLYFIIHALPPNQRTVDIAVCPMMAVFQPIV